MNSREKQPSRLPPAEYQLEEAERLPFLPLLVPHPQLQLLCLRPWLRVRGSARLITPTKATFVEGRAGSDYGVEQQPRSQLGSENHSHFLAEVKFTPGERRETGAAARSAAALRPHG